MFVKLTYSLLLLLTIGLVTSTALVRHQYSVAHSATAKESPVKAPVQESSERGPVRMIRFVVSDDGIYPRRLQVDKGLLNIALEDKTNTADSLLIESVIGDQRTNVTQIHRDSNNIRGRSLIRLGPGRYRVSVATQPDHTAELIVNP
jgi:hypothetical protein